MGELIDPLRIVEAGYAFVPDEREWLRGLLEAARPFEIGTGAAAYTIDLTGDSRVASFVGEASFEPIVRAFTGALPAKVAPRVYAPTEFVGNAAYRTRRLAEAIGRELPRIDAWALVAGDPRVRALTLAWPGGTDFTPDRGFPRAKLLGLVGAHLAAAMRLRRAAGPVSADDDATESVLDPSGKVLHAKGVARFAMASLVEAVIKRERARGRLRRADPREAAALWSVLVDGRWSIVDLVERDGKRMLLARRNPIEGPDLLALTEEERDVMWLSTLGHSHKYVGYELGLSQTAVKRRFTRAIRKMGIASRRELLRKLGGLREA